MQISCVLCDSPRIGDLLPFAFYSPNIDAGWKEGQGVEGLEDSGRES